MENFSTGSTNDNQGELNMSVSAICQTEAGEKYAFVSFSDGNRTAEGKIPDCKIISNNGFAKIEVDGLEQYMSANLASLKKMASQVNIFDAFIK